MANDFIYCPICNSKNITYKDNRKWICKDCGFDLYNNVAAAVGIILTDKDKNILFEIRAKEPRKGFLAFPGGFVDPDESAEEAVKRECKEEIGVEPVNIKYICSFPNTYEYKNFIYKTCDLFFTAELAENAKIKTQETEVTGTKWIKIKNSEDIQKLPLAFESAKKTLEVWLKSTIYNK